VEAQRIPETKVGDKFWKARFDDINALEKHLSRNGTVVLKFFLNVSKEEQKRRFLERIEDPAKHWKFSTRDVDERGHWDDYMAAFEEAINATSTKDAPWYVIPADRKWWMRTLVAEILARTIRGLKIEYPKLSPEGLAAMQKAKERLLAEK
jgi:polyphosphate kinase 2 (PPK2 family)